MKVSVAVLQYDVPMSTDESFAKLEEMVQKAVGHKAQLIVTPETAVGDSNEVKKTGVDYFSRLSEISKKYEIYLATSYYKLEQNKLFNQGYIFNPKGLSIVKHKKIYPAKPEVDDLGIISGNGIEVKNTEIGNLGMLICKDSFNHYSHFLFEKFDELKTDIICVPTWSIGWKKALGVSNDEYVRAFNVYGSFLSRAYVLMAGNQNKNFDSFGRSLIVSPIEGVLKEGSSDKEEILYEILDLDIIPKAREFDSWWQPSKRLA